MYELLHTVAVICVIVSGFTHAQLDPDCVCFEEVEAVRGFRNPLIIVHSGDATDRLFIGEQTGQLWVLERNPESPGGWDKLPDVFLNVSVYFGDANGNEEGFLQVRFHPQYIDNGLLYAWYSLREESGDRFTRLSEFRDVFQPFNSGGIYNIVYETGTSLAVQVDPDNPNMADPDYIREIFTIQQIATNHNGGDLLFLEDGTMLILTGDGGIAGDPFDLALDKTSPLGKALRIDVDNRDIGLEYAIPPDNPFLNDSNALPELYAIGLRNPWRAFQDPVDGRIFIGDVGQNLMEEIDILQKGENFGWSAFEGTTCYKPELCPIYEDIYIPPIHEYSLYLEGGDGQCIIQGPMYRGCENPGFQDWLIFGDYWVGDLYRLLDQADEPVWEGVKDVLPCAQDVCEAAGFSSQYQKWILTYGEDERREVYFGAAEGWVPPDDPTGRVYKMVDPANRGEPCPLPEPK